MSKTVRSQFMQVLRECSDADNDSYLQPYADALWGIHMRDKKGYVDPNEPSTPTNQSEELRDKIWQTIKAWDIERAPGEGYAHATGTDVDTIEALIRQEVLDVLGRLLPHRPDPNMFSNQDAKNFYKGYAQCWDDIDSAIIAEKTRYQVGENA